jgi:hypothetical protein
MLRTTGFICAACLMAAISSPAQSAERGKKDVYTFASLSSPTEIAVRVQAANWLKETGKYNACREQFEAVWSQQDRTLLDKLSATFALGDAEAAKVLAQARAADASAPTALPEVLADTKKPVFFRANLALAYAKTLTTRKVYEEALETFKLFKAEQVVDPSSFLFHKAVAEYGLMLKKDAGETIARLLDDVPSAPERYKTVATLMHFDMIGWQDRSVLDKLAGIGRKMDNVQRRLELERIGKKTQKQQKDVVARLDELIKELENQQDGT